MTNHCGNCHFGFRATPHERKTFDPATGIWTVTIEFGKPEYGGMSSEPNLKCGNPESPRHDIVQGWGGCCLEWTGQQQPQTYTTAEITAFYGASATNPQAPLTEPEPPLAA